MPSSGHHQLERALEQQRRPAPPGRRPAGAGGGPAGWPAGRARRRSGSRPRSSTAGASGVRAHLRLEQLVQRRLPRPPARAAFHSPSSWRALGRRSAAAAPRGAGAGSAAAPASRRCEVPGQPLDRGAARTGRGCTRACRRAPAPSRSACRVRSNFAVPVSTSAAREREPRQLQRSPPGAFCSTNITWNSGGRLRSRSGASSSTSRSNGRSWWA